MNDDKRVKQEMQRRKTSLQSYKTAVNRRLTDLPVGPDWEALATEFCHDWRLDIFPGYTAIESMLAQLDPSGTTTRYGGKGSRGSARTAWFRLVDRQE